MKRRKNFVRALFILVGMAIGYYYLPPLWVTLGIKLHSPLVMMIVNVAIGAIIFGFNFIFERTSGSASGPSCQQAN